MLKKFMERLNDLKEGLKLNKDLIFGISTDNTDDDYYIDEINDEGFIFRKNTRMLMQNHVIIGGMTLVEFESMENYVPLIIVDDIYFKLCDNTKAFIIQHELGHYNYHIDVMMNSVMRNDKMEHEADEYAASIIGIDNAIKAIEDIKRAITLISFSKKNTSVLELDRRLQHLKELANAH